MYKIAHPSEKMSDKSDMYLNGCVHEALFIGVKGGLKLNRGWGKADTMRVINFPLVLK